MRGTAWYKSGMPYEGLSRNASDLVKIVSWAEDDAGKLSRLYRRYPKAQRINIPMVERFLQEEYDAERGIVTEADRMADVERRRMEFACRP